MPRYEMRAAGCLCWVPGMTADLVPQGDDTAEPRYIA
jgi:hypothetical protein